jgi:hypothetical protein
MSSDCWADGFGGGATDKRELKRDTIFYYNAILKIPRNMLTYLSWE